jgi:predicted PurR-regulated permease PerM
MKLPSLWMIIPRWHTILFMIGMIDHAKESPFYLRFGITIITLAILAVGLYFGSGILLPFFFAILLAILLLPAVRFLQRLRLGKIVSIALTIFLTMMVLGSLIYFLSTQVGNFIDDFPTLEKRFHQILWSSQKWVKENMNIGMRAQREYINETTENMKNNSSQIISTTFLTLTGAISYLVFLPIYSFLILYHKDTIKRFLIEICKNGDEHKVRDLLQESQTISQQYLTGLLIELCIVFVLNTTGFLILGIKYPVFLALLSALLNIVPYIGMITANVICMIITIMSSNNTMDGVWVCVILGAVQLVDNNLLMPMIVGNKVKLNAMAIILGVLVAGTLAGVAGMFLAIPGLAVLKLIFERVDRLKPWAILLGDSASVEEETKNPAKRLVSRVRSESKEKKKVST